MVPMNVFAKGGHNGLEQLVNSGYFKLLYLFIDHLIAIYKPVLHSPAVPDVWNSTPVKDVKPKTALVRLSQQNRSPGVALSMLPALAPGPHSGSRQPSERKMFVPNLNVAGNTRKEPEEGGGGQGWREEGIIEGVGQIDK